MDDLFTAFLALVSALDKNKGKDGNTGAIVPQSDLDDVMKSGATWIPGEVTDARRLGKKVEFVHYGEMGEWYWKMPNGTQIRHGRTR